MNKLLSRGTGEGASLRRGSIWGAIAIAVAIVVAPATQALAAPAAASLLPPPLASGPFTIACDGETDFDPTDSTDWDSNRPWPDLTLVDLNRLDAYNAGQVVPLYTAYGDDFTNFPPLCGVHYDPVLDEPVAEWMFCTDRHAEVCGMTNAEGDLVAEDGESIISPMEPRIGNARLTAEQQRLIGFLIREGSRDLNGTYSIYNEPTVGPATAAGTTQERIALQMLIWCVSDPATAESGDEYTRLCAENMNDATQGDLLATIPITPTPALAVTSEAHDPALTVGQEGRVEVSTNVYATPIELTSTPETALALCEPGAGATLSGSTLVVDGTDDSVVTTVALCFTSAAVGTVTVSAQVHALAADGIVWGQSIFPDDEITCQHYAAFFENGTVWLSDAADVAFVAVTTPVKPAPKPTLAESGVDNLGGFLGLGGVTLLLGLGLILARRCRVA